MNKDQAGRGAGLLPEEVGRQATERPISATETRRMTVGALEQFDCGVRMRIGSAYLMSFVFDLYVLVP